MALISAMKVFPKTCMVGHDKPTRITHCLFLCPCAKTCQNTCCVCLADVRHAKTSNNEKALDRYRERVWHSSRESGLQTIRKNLYMSDWNAALHTIHDEVRCHWLVAGVCGQAVMSIVVFLCVAAKFYTFFAPLHIARLYVREPSKGVCGR